MKCENCTQEDSQKVLRVVNDKCDNDICFNHPDNGDFTLRDKLWEIAYNALAVFIVLICRLYLFCFITLVGIAVVLAGWMIVIIIKRVMFYM